MSIKYHYETEIMSLKIDNQGPPKYLTRANITSHTTPLGAQPPLSLNPTKPLLPIYIKRQVMYLVHFWHASTGLLEEGIRRLNSLGSRPSRRSHPDYWAEPWTEEALKEKVNEKTKIVHFLTPEPYLTLLLPLGSIWPHSMFNVGVL